MKMNNIMKGLAAVALLGTMTACSSNYLDQPPISYVSDDKIAQSVEGARAAVYGLCEGMYIGTYGGSNFIRNCNGEGYVRSVYGDNGSQVYSNPFLYGYQPEYGIWKLMTYTGTFCNFVWGYSYNLINQANVILQEIEASENIGDEDKAFLIAQTKTIRAHAYFRLMQVYGPRFEDSNNGEELCVVLRMQPGSEGIPLSSYKDCMKAIYDDLDDALEKFEGSSVKRKYGFEPDINVCKGIYSRVALLNHDWAAAQKMANEARQDYPIMSASEFMEGFAQHNGEWLWYNLPDVDYNGYLSWGANYACNGNIAAKYEWAGAGLINYDFYKECYAKYPNDIRLEHFWTPDKGNKYANLAVKESDFWDAGTQANKYEDAKINSEYLFMYGLEARVSAAISLWVRHTTPAAFLDSPIPGYLVDISLSDEDAAKRGKRDLWFKEKASLANEKTTGRVPFGAQTKFWADPANMWSTEIPFLRAGELILNEAEAAFEQGDETTAKKCLEELNKNRIPGYTCSLTGDDLLDEIRRTRHIELWGEGDAWFSEKRWNIPVVRRQWIAGDTSSNNFLMEQAGSYQPDVNRGWRYEVPSAEFKFNDQIYKK